MAIAACGGAVASPGDNGCPADIRGSVGKACPTEDLTCRTPNCDVCTANCPAVQCRGGAWATAVNTGLCVDAGPPSDGGMCLTVSASDFDQSCVADVDCLAVGVGSACANGSSCVCPAGAISAADGAKYKKAIAALEALGAVAKCFCPYFGAPRCIAKKCTLCGGAAPACPDGG